MAGKTSPTTIHTSPVAVEAKTMQSLFDTLKRNHCSLKGEVKTLFNRCRATDDLKLVKSFLLEYPPLHHLNELLDEVLESPCRLQRGFISTKKTVTPEPTTKGKKRSVASGAVAVSKSLKFSPHLFKKEPPTSAEPSPKGSLQMRAEDSDNDNDDDVVEIQAI